MILDAERLQGAIDDSAVSLDGLAESIARPGLDERQARAAIANWLRGGTTPKAKPEDLNNLARVLNLKLVDLVQFDASHKWARTSARKARLVADLIRDEDIDSALSMLRFSKKRAAVYFRKVLDAAIASAEEHEADVTRLVVAISTVDEGPTLKRFRPKDRGRAHPINKRTAHITVAVVEE